MSMETSEWLNRHTLIGYTEKRGHAWHYRQSEQGEEPNHYPGAIPEEDIVRRLFNWEPVEGTYSTDVKLDGKRVRLTDPSRKNLIHPDTRKIIAGFKKGYQPHSRADWLLSNMHALLDDSELGYGSAGELREGAQAWVQIELPDTINTAQGIEFRPFLGAADSLDGSLSTTYFTGSQLVVCDNTLSAGITGARDIIKYPHSYKSIGRLGEARDALRLIYQEAEDFQAELEALTATVVTDQQWDAFLDAHVPMPEKPGRGYTIAENHRDKLNQLYRKDERVEPWSGTAFGVVQAVSTYAHHEAGVRGAHRAERNASHMVFGDFAEIDRNTIRQLNTVLAA